jgi:hypothetical protein
MIFGKKQITQVLIFCLLTGYELFTVPAVAQTTYPVQVSAHLIPPHSLYLSDYYSGTREKLTVTLINRDQFTPSLNIRLRMTITAHSGVKLQTNDHAYIAPLIIEAGAPVRLTLDDLAPYFQPANLITQGALAAGKLPEGMVEFCFQAFEVFTAQPLSAPSCTRAWITSQKPPLLSLPANNENIAFRDPLNVMFQWTPRHQGQAHIEYEFVLKELWDNGMAPQAAFGYAPEIYRETLRGTSLIYGAAHPALLPGKRYAWTIRAQAREGVEAVNIFQNDGLSEIRWFSLQDNCAPPEVVIAKAENRKLTVEWKRLPEHIGFTISYRLVDRNSVDLRSLEWTELQSNEPATTLYGLKPGATYEYRVASFCVAGQPVYSPILSVTLPVGRNGNSSQCGIMPAISLRNQQPITELKTADVIMANDYPVTITRLSGSNGVYSGIGWTIIPWVNDAKLAVQFNNITINTDKQMIAGYIDAQYDYTEGQIANIDDITEGGYDAGTVKEGITWVDYKFDFSIPGVEAFSLNNNGELVITDTEGTPHTVTPDNKEGQGNEGNKVVVFPMTIQDKDGNIYQVEKVIETDGTGNEKEVAKATFIGKAGEPLSPDSFDPSQLNGEKAIVTFSKGKGYYAFDAWKDYYAGVMLIKHKYQKLYTNYYVPWKFLPASKKDEVSARIDSKDKSIDPAKVIFKTSQGTQFDVQYSNTTKSYTLQLIGSAAGDVQEIYALYPIANNKYLTLGKLSLATYKEQYFSVVLVPVNNVPIDKKYAEQKLKEIYDPVGVHWDLTVDDNFSYDGNTRLMEKSTGLRTYNEDMQALNNAYRAQRSASFNQQANYLFFLKATGATQKNDRNRVAFMPRGSQIGYIFTSEIQDKNEPGTVAHELGHGRFKFFHTFDDHYGGFVKGNTDNLMDYADGTHLAKWQWDVMADPALIVSPFEGDEGSQYTDETYVQKVFQQVRCAYLNGETTLTLDKRGEFRTVSEQFGNVFMTLTIRDQPVLIKPVTPTTLQNGGGVTHVLDYGGLQIKYFGGQSTEQDIKSRDVQAKAIQDDLFPSDVRIEKDKVTLLFAQLEGKDALTDEDLERIRAIANCGAQYFTVDQKISFIKKIAGSQSFLTEPYEDLILDLVESYHGDFGVYAQAFLDKLSLEHGLVRKLFYKIDNEKLLFGNENNADRFMQIIYSLWIATSHSTKNSYVYVEDVIGGTISSPYCLVYKGTSIFPSLGYGDPYFKDGKIILPTKFSNGNGLKTFSYDYFQPVFLIKESGNKVVTYLSTDVPAIMFAGIIEKDNFEQAVSRISVSSDIILTFTGVGNLAKLRHLSRIRQVGVIILCGLEFGTTALDILLNYTTLCTDPVFCEKLKQYNFYIQMSLLGGEAVSGLYRAALSSAKASAKDAYLGARDALIAKYGDNSPELKALDEHFDIHGKVNGLAYYKNISLLPEDLRNKIESKNWPGHTLAELDVDLSEETLRDAFSKNHNLADAWKLLEYSNHRHNPVALRMFSLQSFSASYEAVIRDGISRRYPNIPIEELAAIVEYTATGAYDLNKALRIGNPNEHFKLYAEILNDALSKLPEANVEKVLRGVQRGEARAAATWEIGKVLHFADFKSTSRDIDGIADFVDGVIYEIIRPQGYDVCKISCKGNEAEILLKSGTDFKIVAIDPTFKIPNYTTVRKIVLAPLTAASRHASNWLDKLPQELLTKIEAKNWSDEVRSRLDADLSNEALRAAVSENHEFIDAWKLLENSRYRTDIGALELFSDSRMVQAHEKATTLLQRYPDIPVEELATIIHYTGSGYYNLNEALRSGNPGRYYQVFEKMLNDALSKLPEVNVEKVFRGVHEEEARIANTWRVGDKIHFNDFKSTTTRADEAGNGIFTDNVIYEIINPLSYDVSNLSGRAAEAEVLIKSGSDFKVVSIDPAFKIPHSNKTVKKIILDHIRHSR